MDAWPMTQQREVALTPGQCEEQGQRHNGAAPRRAEGHPDVTATPRFWRVV